MDFNKRNIFILVSILILSCSSLSFAQAGFIETEFKESINQAIQKRVETVNLAYDISIKEVDVENIQQLIKNTIKEADDYTASAVNKWNITIKGTTEEIELNINFDYHRSLEMTYCGYIMQL